MQDRLNRLDATEGPPRLATWPEDHVLRAVGHALDEAGRAAVTRTVASAEWGTVLAAIRAAVPADALDVQDLCIRE